MPTVKTFARFEIYMYFEDHGIPHFHIVSADYSASIAIEDFTILAGGAPTRIYNQATAWAVKNRPLLRWKWTEYSE
jgi:hypothetical protein